MTTWIGITAIAIGILMVLMWAVSLRQGRVPELTTRPAEIRLHLTAEIATAVTLVVGGVATVVAPGGPLLLLFGLGMLTYTTIVSPGYFLDRGQTAPVAMFAVILIVAIAGAALLIVEFLG